MKHLASYVCGCLVAMVACATPYDGVVTGAGESYPAGYMPPLLANGELAMTVDALFGVRDKHIRQYSQGIYLEGRRVGHPKRELLPQGRWHKRLTVDGAAPGAPVTWTQWLDIRAGVATSRIEYPCGLVFEGEAFIPLSQNTIALRMRASSRAERPLAVTMGVGYDAPRHERIVGAWRTNGNVRTWAYTSYGYRVQKGETSVHGADASFTLAPGASEARTFFIAYSDTMRPHPGVPRDYAALRAANDAEWARYWGESSVTLPDRDLQRLWVMAGYHLRINATPWSFPVGILDSHWQGLYFGFDEMYMYQGLASAGHLSTARHEPDYRFATLGTALARNRYGGQKAFVKYGARWYWESVEDGRSEGTVAGEWMDHVFHMATIAKCAWQQWLYGRDRIHFAKKGYPVVYECARFFRNNWVYEDSNGDTYIGKCCDLERLGPSRDHPFMTTVGAIYTLRAAADASDLLATNAVDAADFRAVADRLERHLPQRDGRYVACLNEPQESMATLAGFFPFPIFGPEHALQGRAVRHFIDSGRASGNMYPTGKKICPWYAGTMSAAASWMEDRHEPVRWLREAFSAAGLFGEYFEINEPPDAVYHPWFATAAGNCLYAIDQMLLCDRGGAIYLGFTVPEAWTDYAFRLPSLAGVTVDCAVKGGRLARLDVTPRPGVEGEVRLVLRPSVLNGVPLDPAWRVLSRASDRVALALSTQSL